LAWEAFQVLNQGTEVFRGLIRKTNKVVATQEVGVPGPGGDIAAGRPSLVTSFDFRPPAWIPNPTMWSSSSETRTAETLIRIGLRSVCHHKGPQRRIDLKYRSHITGL
jgi:hypothetical protein